MSLLHQLLLQEEQEEEEEEEARKCWCCQPFPFLKVGVKQMASAAVPCPLSHHTGEDVETSYDSDATIVESEEGEEKEVPHVAAQSDPHESPGVDRLASQLSSLSLNSLREVLLQEGGVLLSSALDVVQEGKDTDEMARSIAAALVPLLEERLRRPSYPLTPSRMRGIEATPGLPSPPNHRMSPLLFFVS